MACQFACGKTEATGDRAISLKTRGDATLWRCFHYGCTVRGNVLTLMHWMKHDRPPAGDRLQGREFKEMAEDLKALVRGEPRTTKAESHNEPTSTKDTADKSAFNIPLKDSENERARSLVNLDEKFVTDVAEMSPQAASYVRSRPYMTPEIMQKFRCGYLPQDAGSLLRGHFVYGWADQHGDILTWFGRNLNYETQHRKWRRAGDSSKEPNKFKFVKGFHRGLVLYGENVFRSEANAEQVRDMGVIVVEGPNDVINLNALGVPAVAVCSNTVTEKQADKLAALACEFSNGTVSVMFDLDRQGENGAGQTVLKLAQRCCVRYAWTTSLSDGRFSDRQPESVTPEEWEKLIYTALTA
ncbi:toprim domain-containing protein [Symmachiella dynata]|nr:toprim domain-containing protein [Symmachiella dynata]